MISAAIVFLTNCTSSVIPSGPDTYTVTASGAGFGTGGVQSSVYAKANEYCRELGLTMVPVSIQTREGVYGQRPPSAELVFKALKQGDPNISQTKTQYLRGPPLPPRIAGLGASGFTAYANSGRHSIKSVEKRNGVVVLDDGSVWIVDSFDRLDLTLWMSYDDVVVVENAGEYLLVNTNDKHSVKAQMVSR